MGVITLPRKPRIHFPDAFLHVMARGNNNTSIFDDAEDFMKYLLICPDYLGVMDISVLAYALMPNHIHLLVQVGEEPVSGFMKMVQQKYTQYYNHKNNTCGHVFQGRYKAVLVDSDSYFLTVLNYICRNPLKAGLEKVLGEYRWTGHYEILQGKNYILDKARLLSFFHQQPAEAAREYLRLIHRDDLELTSKESSPESEPRQNGAEAIGLCGDCGGLNSYELLDAVARALEIDKTQIIGNSKNRNASLARKVFIYLIRANVMLTVKDLSLLLNVSEEYISRVYQRLLFARDDDPVKVIARSVVEN
jgi:putative transposase